MMADRTPLILIISNNAAESVKIQSYLELQRFKCATVNQSEASTPTGDVAVIDIDNTWQTAQFEALLTITRQREQIPAVILLPPETLHLIQEQLLIEDFILKPWDSRELVLRIRRIIGRYENLNNNVIVCNDLRIDIVKCEVSLAGELLDLTFTEYELLKYLASNRGRVFSREALLTNVWGYNYYGGERTVDVHIRRLRSKIEVGNRIFVETVRNIGYKFDDFSSKKTKKISNSAVLT